MQHFELAGSGEQSAVSFELTPPAANARGTVHAVALAGGKTISLNTETIRYSHFPEQTLFPPVEASLVRADIKNLSKNVGYVMGAGDEVPGSLRQIGCDVTLLSSEDLSHSDLSRYDAIVTGVRAWNTRADLRANYQRLYDYVSNGGTMIVEYSRPEGGAPGGGRGGRGAAGRGATPGGQTQTQKAAGKQTAQPAAAPSILLLTPGGRFRPIRWMQRARSNTWVLIRSTFLLLRLFRRISARTASWRKTLR